MTYPTIPPESPFAPDDGRLVAEHILCQGGECLFSTARLERAASYLQSRVATYPIRDGLHATAGQRAGQLEAYQRTRYTVSQILTRRRKEIAACPPVGQPTAPPSASGSKVPRIPLPVPRAPQGSHATMGDF